MMIMTIWWSKATRLLEFSRSRPQGLLTCGPGFFVTEDRQTEELGILVSGFYRLASTKLFELVL